MSPAFQRPRRGSNSQPLDSKSITLSIELRGLARNYTRILDLFHFEAHVIIPPRSILAIYYL
jgi:hypothetical protein